MKKILFILLVTHVSLFAAGFWTLTGLTKANVYLVNEVAYLDANAVTKTKEKMTEMLHSLNIKTEQQDAPTLMISLKEIENDGTHYIYVELALGEEVQTFREDKSATFAFTYVFNDFIEVDSDELNKSVLESVDFVLSQFVEQFKEDKE